MGEWGNGGMGKRTLGSPQGVVGGVGVALFVSYFFVKSLVVVVVVSEAVVN